MMMLKELSLGDLLGAIESFLTSVAILAGGVWAYYQFYRGRIYRTRLKTRIQGQFSSADDRLFLMVTCTVENCGISKVDLKAEGSGFRISRAAGRHDDGEDVATIDWRRLATFPVFEDHKWLESSETISDDHLLDLTMSGAQPVLLEMRIVVHGISFKARSVVFPDSKTHHPGED